MLTKQEISKKLENIINPEYIDCDYSVKDDGYLAIATWIEKYIKECVNKIDAEYLEFLAYRMDDSNKKGEKMVGDIYFDVINMIMTKRQSRNQLEERTNDQH